MKLMFEILNEMSIHVKNFMGISHEIYIKTHMMFVSNIMIQDWLCLLYSDLIIWDVSLLNSS